MIAKAAECTFVAFLGGGCALYGGAPQWGAWAVAWFSALIVVYGVGR